VIVAVDGSPGSDHAVAAAAAREWPKGTRIQVVAALEGIGLTDALRGIKEAALGSRKDMRLTWVEKKSEAAARRLAAPGLLVTTAVKVGDPRIVVLREAREWEADCIFLGSRGLAGVERFLLGSVSASVAAHAPCTVEVIRKSRGNRKARTSGKARGAAAGGAE
jgi:nucleotide-binding universal stress UspA family protein